VRIKTSVLAVVVISVAAAILLKVGLSAQSPGQRAGASNPAPTSAENTAQPQKQEESRKQEESVDGELSERLRKLCERAGAVVGVAVIHVETGRSAEVQGTVTLPLYSVFKLPLAVSVLKDVEENRLRLDQKVSVTPADVAPGWTGNSALWRKPVEKTVSELLELSIGRSDNTSSDKLLQLVGGPGRVTERMRALGFKNIDIHFSTREAAAERDKPNTGAASDLAHLLARLQKGEVLQPPQTTLLLGFMMRATTGERRLRGNLPPGTPVADKTGTGEPGTSTNDVGLITLPSGRGHLAMAVLVSGSKLPAAAQEKLIAELARAAYDAHVARATPTRQ
jgi:beta-lactamase class A